MTGRTSGLSCRSPRSRLALLARSVPFSREDGPADAPPLHPLLLSPLSAPAHASSGTNINTNNKDHTYYSSRRFRPNVKRLVHHSDVLGAGFRMQTTTKALREIKRYGGFDNYLVRTLVAVGLAQPSPRSSRRSSCAAVAVWLTSVSHAAERSADCRPSPSPHTRLRRHRLIYSSTCRRTC